MADSAATNAGAGVQDNDPVLTHADALNLLLSRVVSWVSAAEGLRRNIQSVANAQKESAARLRKLAGAPVHFQAPAAAKGSPAHVDTLTSASHGCFDSIPAQMAAFHEEISSNLTLLDQRQGKEVERLAKKYRAAVETVVSTMADRVDKSRGEFEAKAVSLQTLLQSGQQHAQVWLNQIQQAAARREEREASSQYCQQARALWDQAYKHEAEITSKMREVMVLFIQCQSAAVGKLDLSLEAHSRTMKAVDCAAGRRIKSHNPPLSLLTTTPLSLYPS